MNGATKVGIIGLGAIAGYFLDAIADCPDFDLAAVCDLSPEKLMPFASSGVRTFTSHQHLLSSKVAEAVIITVPNDLHATIAIAALSHGIHVCCEKPLAVSSAEADTVVAAARNANRVLMTAFHRRYNMRVKRLACVVADSGATVKRVRARYYENILEHTGGDSWYLDVSRCGGGCLIDNGPNALDAVRHVVGPLTLEDASIGDVRAGVEFCADLTLRTQAGAPVTIELDWALPTGECKDIEVEFDDGRVLTADMLTGFTAFKSSLSHEYAGIVRDFLRVIEAPEAHCDMGPRTVELVETAYELARAKERRLRMSSKHPLSASLVKLLFHGSHERGMALSPWKSRCVRAGEIHELVTTTDRPVRPGDHVDRVGFLGFVAFDGPGIIERGDEVWLRDKRVGTVAGFDECHAANHLNVLIDAERPYTAGDLDATIGQEVRFVEESQ